MLSHLVTSVWEKTKIANSYVDIWWCPWDKGGAVIYVIGGTHPPIWLPIDINHHQISNGHAFPSAMNINLFQNLLLNLCVCAGTLQLVFERQRRGNLWGQGVLHTSQTQGKELLQRQMAAPLHSTPWHGPPSKKPQSGSMVVENKRFSHKQIMPKPLLSLYWPWFWKKTHSLSAKTVSPAMVVYRTLHWKATYRQSGGLSISASANWQIGLKCCVPDLVRDVEFGFCRSIRPG